MSMRDGGPGGVDLTDAPVPNAAAAIERALLVNMSRTEVLLVRHGQQSYRRADRPRAVVVDAPLTETGERQARLVGQYLVGEPITSVYCSDLQRARHTAEILTAQLGLTGPPTVVPELREVELFRGLPRDRPLVEVLGREPLELASNEFMHTRRFDAFPQTEASAELRTRAVNALTEIVTEHADERIVVVAHGGIINAFLAEVLGISIDMFFFPAHASVTRALHNDDRWALYSANETPHLQDGQTSLVTF